MVIQLVSKTPEVRHWQPNFEINLPPNKMASGGRKLLESPGWAVWCEEGDQDVRLRGREPQADGAGGCCNPPSNLTLTLTTK